MAKFYIEYWRSAVKGGGVQAPSGLLGKDVLDIGGSTVRTSSDIPSGCEAVTFKTDTNCQYEMGDDSVEADANSQYLHAGSTFSQGSENFKRIAVIEQQT